MFLDSSFVDRAFLWVEFLALSVFAGTLIHRRWLSPLAKYPGPALASVTRLWLTWTMWTGKQNIIVPKLHRQYGEYVRIAPNELSICNAEGLRLVYGVQSRSWKSDWFKVFRGSRKFDLVAEQDVVKHGSDRRLVAQAYSLSNLIPLEHNIDDTLVTLCAFLDSHVEKVLDVSAWIQYWSFDTVGQMTFSKPFGFLTAGCDWNHALRQIREASDSAAWVGQNPWFFTLIDKTWSKLFGSPFALSNRNGIIRNFAIEQATIRQNRMNDRNLDIMHSLLQVHKQNPMEFDADALKSMAATNIFGGAETTATTIRSVMYFLLRSPDDYRRLVNEIDCVLDQEMAESFYDITSVPYRVTERMPFLAAVIYEAMRLFPANGLLSSRVVPSGGLDIQGNYLPPGSHAVVMSWALHQNEDIFGRDAGVFRPGRWTDDADDAVKGYHRNFMSFGYGARLCLGKHLAWLELTKVLVVLFRRYSWRLEDPQKSWLTEGSFIYGQRNINLIPTRRVSGDARRSATEA